MAKRGGLKFLSALGEDSLNNLAMNVGQSKISTRVRER